MSCWKDGNPESPILLVGMAPGRDELAADKPFIGGSGRLLWSQMKLAGMDRADCYIVNVIGEWPEATGGAPTKAQYDKWFDRVNDALLESKAKVMVLLGKDAFQRVTGLTGGIESWRGYLIEREDCVAIPRTVEEIVEYKSSGKGHKKGDPRAVRRKVAAPPPIPPLVRWVLPTLHPSGVMRSGMVTLPAFIADLRRVKRALDGELEVHPENYSNAPIALPAHKAVACDIETPMDSRAINRVGMATEDGTWTAPWDNRSREAVASLLKQKEVVKVFQNMSFDVPRLEESGVPIEGPFWDTMLSAQMLQPDLPKGLNYIISLYLDRKRHKHLSELEPAFYNAMDVKNTLHLYDIHKDLLEQQGSLKLFEETIMPAIPVLMRMTSRGLKVDESRRTEWLWELDVKAEKLFDWWEGRTGVNPSSPKQLSKYLYGTLGLTPQYNKYGGISTDAGAMAELKRLSPDHVELLDCLHQLKQTNKLRSTYARTALGGDGCVHPQYLPSNKDFEGKDMEGGTSFTKGMAGTGRIAASDPPIQQQPIEARKIFIPHSPDMILAEFDYSQIELRIAAALSGDKKLQEALEGDVHAATQAALKCDRVRAKNILYGTLYGAGPRKLSMVLKTKGYNISERECKEMQDALSRTYKDLFLWRTKVVQRMSTSYSLRNPFGRTRYFLRGGADAPAGLDFLPQSTAADIFWSILVPVDEYTVNVGGALLAPIHDSILVELPSNPSNQLVGVCTGILPSDECRTAISTIKSLMQREFPNIAPGFRVPINVKVGRNWGEMVEYNEETVV
jgi:uracil-DNA glycosylase family 4